MPKDWEPFLLKKPLRGKVIKVFEDGRAKVDCGTESGAWKGMELWADTQSFGQAEFVEVDVVEVEAKTCVIRSKLTSRDSVVFMTGQGVRSRRGRDD